MSTHKEQTQISRQNGQEIDDAIKTEDIGAGFMDNPDSQTIFKSENNGNAPFQYTQQVAIFILDGWHTLEHHQNNTQYDNAQKHHIE